MQNDFKDVLNNVFSNNKKPVCTGSHCPPKIKNNWYSAKSTGDHADIHLYGGIGGEQVNIIDFEREILKYKNYKTINVFISSLGGTFRDGLPIYNMLKQHKAHITTINMGYAVSMASHILLAGDTIKMAENALIMIHSPLTVIWNYINARDLLKEADLLDKHEEVLIPAYARRMNLSNDEIKKIMQKETWYTAKEALKAGLIDEITVEVDLTDIEEKMKTDGWRGAVGITHAQYQHFQNLHFQRA